LRIVILYNPNAGRGRGERVAKGVHAMLLGLAHSVDLLATAKEPPDAFLSRIRAAICGADLLIVVGGDGTLHHTLPAVVGSGVPVYHLAMGTENLFARQFGMDRLPDTLAGAVHRWQLQEVDVGRLIIGAASQPFVLVCSVGPDASVIRRLDEARRGPISHLSYLKPIAAELLDLWLPRLTIDVDGQRIIENQQGMVMIANSRQYAVRLDPAYKASMTDGLLDVVFMPCTGRWSTLMAMARCRLRKHGRSITYRQGASVRIHAEDPRPPALQVDGECKKVAQRSLDLQLDAQPKALKVLTP
jgi:diacylglycerol kinase (ATP)